MWLILCECICHFIEWKFLSLITSTFHIIWYKVKKKTVTENFSNLFSTHHLPSCWEKCFHFLRQFSFSLRFVYRAMCINIIALCKRPPRPPNKTGKTNSRCLTVRTLTCALCVVRYEMIFFRFRFASLIALEGGCIDIKTFYYVNLNIFFFLKFIIFRYFVHVSCNLVRFNFNYNDIQCNFLFCQSIWSTKRPLVTQFLRTFQFNINIYSNPSFHTQLLKQNNIKFIPDWGLLKTHTHTHIWQWTSVECVVHTCAVHSPHS